MEKIVLFIVCVALAFLARLFCAHGNRVGFLLGVVIGTIIPWLGFLYVGHGINTSITLLDLPIYAIAASGLVAIVFGRTE